MASMPLRPMSMGEILDASFALLRRYAGVFFGIAVLCQGPPMALGLFVQFTGGAPRHFGLYALAQVLGMVAYLLVTGASIRVVSEVYLGREPQMAEALRFAGHNLGRTLSSGLAAGLLAVLGTLLLIVPGIIAFCGLAVAVQAAVLESLANGLDGVGRSWTLTRGFRWKAFGLYVVVGVLFLVLSSGVGLMAGLAAWLAPVLLRPAMVAFALFALFIYPFTSCVFTLFYYDLRIRKEAFDLELLNRQLGLAALGA